MWKIRVQAKFAYQKRGQHDRAEQSGDLEFSGLESRDRDDAPAQRMSSSRGQGTEHVSWGQLAPYGNVRELSSQGNETLQEVTHLVGKPAAGEFFSGRELTRANKLRELNGLLAMAKNLAKITVSASLTLSPTATTMSES